MKPLLLSIRTFPSAISSRPAPDRRGLRSKLTLSFILCSLLTTFTSAAEAQLFVASFDSSSTTTETAEPAPVFVTDTSGEVVAPVFESAERILASTSFVGGSSLDIFSGTDDLLAQVSQTIFVPNNSPAVTIIGGNRTIADTDNVTGELVAFSGTATDSGGITSTRWLIDGAVVATGTSATLALNDGTTLVSFAATDDTGASTTTSVTYTVLAPAFNLPRISGFSTLRGASDSEFSVSIRDVNNFPVAISPVTQALAISGFIFPQDTDENFIADTFVVAVTPSGWFMRNLDGAFVRWNGIISDLVPAFENQQLTAQVLVPIFTGKLQEVGTYRIYVGYMRVDSSELIYTANAAELIITP